jgi:hypothetical protein
MLQNRLQDISGNDVNQFLLEVQRGEIAGAKILWKFGRNSDIDAGQEEDLWEFGGQYSELTQNTTLYMWSSDDSDTVSIQVTGVDEDFTEVNITQELTGTTPIILTEQYLAICSASNADSVPFSGTIIISRVYGSSAQGDVVATITPAAQTSLLGRCIIPAGFTGYLFHGTASANVSSVVNTAAAVVRFRMKLYGNVWKLVDEVPAASGLGVPRPWFKFPEKTLLKATGESYDSNNTVRAAFGLLILDNTIWR